jgi:hypothetical protein
MARLILLATACLAIVGSVSAATTPVPPRLYTVDNIDQKKGDIVGVCHTVRFINHVPLYETQGWTLSLPSTDCFDVQGNKLTVEQIVKRLSVGDVVAVSADGGKVDPVFLKALAKDTLVFVSKDYAVNNVLSLTDPSGQTLRASTPLIPRSR